MSRGPALLAPGAPGGAQAQARSRAFQQDFAAKADEAGWAAAGLGADPAGFLDKALLLDEAAEILLVQPHSGQGFDRALQLQQRKEGGINSNTTGRYLILPRRRPIAVARMRRWSAAIGTPDTGASPDDGSRSGPRRASSISPAS